MKVYINNSEINENSININTGLNFGRFNYEGLVINNYKISLSVTEFIRAIESDYNKIKDEIKKDDEMLNETSEFTAIHYCSIKELLKNKQALKNIITSYLDVILFKNLFSQSKNTRYIINSTEFLEVKDNNIHISGRCYLKKNDSYK